MHSQRTTQFLFNTYTNATGCKGNSCSAALNKWLKQHLPKGVIHFFRHSFRDRLRNAGVQSEMIDQLGGWSNQTVGQEYGEGFEVKILSNATTAIALRSFKYFHNNSVAPIKR
jgi:integrase